MRKTPLSIVLAAALGLTALPAASQERSHLGYGRLVTNDLLSNLRDRWRTGSASFSRIYGYSWEGALPERAGDLVELRLRGEIVAPASLGNPRVDDRPYAGIWSLGVHSHFQQAGTEFSFGADVAVVGPQTGLDQFQGAVHDGVGITPPNVDVRDGQIEDGVHPTLLVEVGQPISLGSGDTQLRPFVEAQAGIETYVRAGMDVQFGAVGLRDLMVRDPVTGHRYRTVQDDTPGVSFVLGADMARVSSSVLLPESRGYQLTDIRNRVRAGVHWQGEKNSAFYGLTWLGEEFEAQPEGQLVGSLRLNFEF